MTLRKAHPSDAYWLYEICHRTGHNGQDASPYIGDRQLLGQYFAAPYLVRDSSWCWVVADEQGVAGYLVATPDSRAFAAWMNDDWLPAVRRLVVENPEAASPTESWIRRTIHSPATVPGFVDDYPAHMHIDLLPRVQGQGLGRTLITAFLDQLRTASVPGFHLGVGEANLGAQAFYAKQGLQVIVKEPGVVYFGLKSPYQR